MSGTKMFPVPPNFNMDDLVQKVTQMYQAKGFDVTSMPMGSGGASIDFRKNDGGIQKYVGLALGIRANIMLQNNTVVINFSDPEWTGKIVGLAIGWVFCLIPFIIAIVGCVQQSEFPQSVGNDIQALANTV
ncbi:MAG: hypothetical protein FWD99_06495 [Oscillospiraceae bacterium]|nr:hypothetical protein [Oscillospiraceae bacterium]